MARKSMHLGNKKQGRDDNDIITDERNTLVRQKIENKIELKFPKEARLTWLTWL